jgi:hypothetical protein
MDLGKSWLEKLREAEAERVLRNLEAAFRARAGQNR